MHAAPEAALAPPHEPQPAHLLRLAPPQTRPARGKQRACVARLGRSPLAQQRHAAKALAAPQPAVRERLAGPHACMHTKSKHACRGLCILTGPIQGVNCRPGAGWVHVRKATTRHNQASRWNGGEVRGRGGMAVHWRGPHPTCALMRRMTRPKAAASASSSSTSMPPASDSCAHAASHTRASEGGTCGSGAGVLHRHAWAWRHMPPARASCAHCCFPHANQRQRPLRQSMLCVTESIIARGHRRRCGVCMLRDAAPHPPMPARSQVSQLGEASSVCRTHLDEPNFSVGCVCL